MCRSVFGGGLVRIGTWAGGLAVLVVLGCQGQGETQEVGGSISTYRDRMLVQRQEEAARRSSSTAKPVSWQSELPEKAALMTQPAATTQPTPAEVLAEIPDPVDAPSVFRERLRVMEDVPQPDVRVIRNYEKVLKNALEYLEMVYRPAKMRLSLAECIQRALEHNYAIRYEAYNPAISQTQVVEAEAAFDAEFFLEGSWGISDRAVTSELQAATIDTRLYQGGFRKLLPTGMWVTTALSQQRTDTDFAFQTVNPAYDTSFNVTFTQPLLRGFGLEYNRAQLNISRAERDIAYETFIQRVRDTLLEVETTYWLLVQARRTAAVLAETVAQNKVTYLGIQDRIYHDATEVELKNAESRWRQREVQYFEAIKEVRDAEDQLKNLLNDPGLKLSGEIEIVPTETPFAAALALDQLGAVRTALDNRSEIRAARRGIDQARINTAWAKNETLPQLDLTFEYEVQGIGVSADASFDNVTTNRFISYTVSAQFSYPIGNRARRAAHRRARLQESQAVVTLNRWTDEIVRQVNEAVRTLTVRYTQVPPQLDAVRAAERNLRALQARTQRIDPLYLDNELSSVERLASARTTLLQVIADYNVAIVGLEGAQGTLLEYNNVVVTDEPPGR